MFSFKTFFTFSENPSLEKQIFAFETQKNAHNNVVPKIIIRPTQLSDIEAMVSLSKTKRLAYEKAQPQFWRHNGELGDHSQRQWFQELLEDENYLM